MSGGDHQCAERLATIGTVELFDNGLIGAYCLQDGLAQSPSCLESFSSRRFIGKIPFIFAYVGIHTTSGKLTSL